MSHESYNTKIAIAVLYDLCKKKYIYYYDNSWNLLIEQGVSIAAAVCLHFR